MNKPLFDILHRCTNVKGLHFLEASAGTGKTFAIEHLFARLILETSITIDKILVVTFTRAATRELKTRIRATLIRTKERLLASTADSDYLLAIQEKGQAAMDGAAKKIEAALICFDAAQIFTLHGFCHRMLSEFSFECCIAGTLVSPEHAYPAFYYKRAVETYVLYGLSPRDFCPAQIQIALKKAHHDPARLIAKIVSLLSCETTIAPYRSLEELSQEFMTRLSAFPPIVPEKLIEDFLRVSICYKGMKNAVYQEQMGMLSALLHRRTCSREDFEKLISDQASFLDQMSPEHRKAKSALPTQDTLHYPGIFDAMRLDLLPLIQEASSPMKILLRLAKGCESHAKHILARQECFSPDQMLHRLETALASPGFLEAIRKKYSAAIVDEFQDTDPIQWKILNQVFVGHLEALCLVGDPKQSIYSFRSADVYIYLDAARILGKDNHKHLDTNFRSTPALIDALNNLFRAPKGKGWITLPRLQETLSVDPVKAGSTAESQSHLLERGAIHFFVAQAERKRSAQWPSLKTEEHQLLPFLASEICRIREKRNVPFEEIAVLVKDRFQAERLVHYLKLQGIPSAFRRGENIASTDALSAFRECLEAVISPSDLSALKVALGGILIGWDEELLKGHVHSTLLYKAKAQMQLLQNTLYQKGFGPFFSAFLQAIWPPFTHSTAERILARGDLFLYHTLRKLSEILIEEGIARKLQGIDFLHALRDIEKQSDQQEPRFEVSPREAKGSVAVMTMHLSKGLEFDTVFAIALCSRHVIKEDQPVKKGRERLLAAMDEQHLECLEAIEELDAEKMRSLYVSLTRAKQQLYIAYVIDESEKSLKIGDASPLELFFAKISKECRTSCELYEEIRGLNRDRIEKILHALSKSCALTYGYLDVCQQGRSLPGNPSHVEISPPSSSLFVPEPRWIYSFSSLASPFKEENREHSDTFLSDNVLPHDCLPLGSQTGTIVHRIFERIFKRGLHHPFHEKKIQELITCEIAETPLAYFKKSVCEMVIASLNLAFIPPSGCLKNIPANHLYQELEFLFPIHQTAMMKGFADLIFMYEDRYYLLDWKTNFLGSSPQDYTQENMKVAMDKHQYFLQAAIYSSALQRYVKLFDNRPFEAIFGGAFYVFVRGSAVFHFVPKWENNL